MHFVLPSDDVAAKWLMYYSEKCFTKTAKLPSDLLMITNLFKQTYILRLKENSVATFISNCLPCTQHLKLGVDDNVMLWVGHFQVDSYF